MKAMLFYPSLIIMFGFLSFSTQAQERSWIDLAVHNFGAPINTMWAEGELSFADDGTMVYCSARQDMAVAPGDPKDLYLASFNEETGSWDTPINMGIPINAAPATDVHPLRAGDDREPWITADGNTIYFRSDRLASDGNAIDLFVTNRVNGAWTEPELLPYPISTDEGNEHCPAILQDGVTLCFASMRAGGYGGSDIYCSQKDEGGNWTDPINQGPNINTAAEEFHFTQDTDGMVYFTSTRPGGFGGRDIYGAMQMGPNSWDTSFNLGPTVNTSAEDMCPALPPGADSFSWFSSRSDNNLGSFDIYWTKKANIENQ
ncbi:MAG: hypothetical protein P8N11_02540 [Gammaproteobacteria bacterium]|jgi:hypothetical protein|nr:hypothetical protein [Gammaproteobacteria bacterium]